VAERCSSQRASPADERDCPSAAFPEELMEERRSCCEANPFARVPRSLHDQRPSEKKRASDPFLNCCAPTPSGSVSGSALVIVIILTLQAGPLLTEFAISHGMERQELERDRGVPVLTSPSLRQCLLPTSAGQRPGSLFAVMHNSAFEFHEFSDSAWTFFTERRPAS